MAGKTAVVTGASSGIGTEFARYFAGKGYQLVISARRRERLIQLKRELEGKYDITCDIVTADLLKQEECLQLYEAIRGRRIHVFINNAGFGECGKFAETDLGREMDMVQVNVLAMHRFTKWMVQKFRRQGYGYLLNVASSAGLFPAGPYMAAYYATKAYMASLTRAVAAELLEEKSPVYVGVLCPGPVDTEFNEVANVEFALPGISAKRCVLEAVRGMKKRRIVIVPSVQMKLAVAGQRLLPERCLIGILSHQQKKKF